MAAAVGVSTVHAGLLEVPEAYAEAPTARDGLGGAPGVLALPMLSSFDYLVLREDETARRLIRPQLLSSATSAVTSPAAIRAHIRP